ncbi:MAG: 3-deoxy-D-manno-octulosonic acid transferase [Pirellulales bacterium]
MVVLRNVVYLALLVLALPLLLWRAARTGKYRETLWARFWGLAAPRDSQARCVWLHGVSVGEINLIVPLVAAIECRWPDCECVISATTATGLALARARFPHHRVIVCPLDFSWAVRRVVRAIRPDLLLLAELEVWPNLIDSVRASGGRVGIVNGRLSEKSFRGYRRIRPLVARSLRRIDVIAAQNEDYAERFRRLGARPASVHVTGSIKFDGAVTDRDNPATAALRSLLDLPADASVLLAGSTQEPEEAIVLEAFTRLAESHPQLRLVIVPRHPERFAAVAETIAHSGHRWYRRSALGDVTFDRTARVLLVDTVGELSAWWGVADVGYVGGSLGSRGGQNMIEPAGYGVPICFGPNTRNFRDVVMLLTGADAACVVHNVDELAAFVEWTLSDATAAASMGRRAAELVRQQAGALGRTLDLLEPVVARLGTTDLGRPRDRQAA